MTTHPLIESIPGVGQWLSFATIEARTGASRHTIRQRLKERPSYQTTQGKMYLASDVDEAFPPGRYVSCSRLVRQHNKTAETIKDIAKRHKIPHHRTPLDGVVYLDTIESLLSPPPEDHATLDDIAADVYVSVRTLQRLVQSEPSLVPLRRGSLRYYPRAAIQALLK